MKKNNLFKFGAMALAAVVMMAACNGGDDGGSDVKVTGVSVSPDSKTLAVGGSVTLTATVSPSNATVKTVTWSVVPASGVVTVSNNGVVTAVAKGTAVVTATTTDGNKTATCNITVDGDGPVTTANITIDGQFTDWAAADAAELTTVFQVGPNALFDDLKVLKLYATPAYLNVYVEFDAAIVGKTDPSGQATTMHMYIDVDGGETTTGYNNPTNANNFFDYHLEDSVTPWTVGDHTIGTYNPPLRHWPADAMSAGDPWNIANEGANNLGAGFTVGNGVIDGAVVKYEYQITRELLPAEFPSTIYVLFDVQENWTASGLLPMNGDGSGLDGDVNVPAGKAFAWVIGD